LLFVIPAVSGLLRMRLHGTGFFVADPKINGF